MEINETIQETAKREVYEETGVQIKQLELFGIYSGTNSDKTFANGDQVSMVQIICPCREYDGHLVERDEESLHYKFYRRDVLPHNLFPDYKDFFKGLLSKKL